MSRSNLYLLLAIVGAIVPWVFFAGFFQVEGFGGKFLPALFVNGAAGGVSADLLISSHLVPFTVAGGVDPGPLPRREAS